MEATCINHSEIPSIETCEACGDPLCGMCLWYGSDGRRYCETHAKAAELAGETIYSPNTYSDGIVQTLRTRESASAAYDPAVPYKGNSNDLFAFLGVTIAAVSLASCVGGIYCLPVVGGILGIIAYINADKSIDPKRTRTMGIIAMVGGGIFLLLIVIVFVLYGTLIFTAISSGGGGFP